MLVPIISAPSLQQVDTRIFTLRYFGHCLRCNFCEDSCCQYGCDVNLAERDRILAVQDELAPFVSAPVGQWFKEEVFEDPEYESGRFVRSAVLGKRCAFMQRGKRGCGIHAFALATGRDYHQLKPVVCWLFPVTWDRGVLRPSSDVDDDLVCRGGTGPTLYQSARDEIRQVFGEALVAELDKLERDVPHRRHTESTKRLQTAESA